MKTDQPYILTKRDIVVLSCIVLAFTLLVSRAAYLLIYSTELLTTEGNARYMRNETIVPARGVIKDRNGVTLAISTPVDSIIANPVMLIEEEQEFSQLAEALDLSEDEIYKKVKKYADKDRRFVYLKRHMPQQKAKEVINLDLSGISILREYRRYYPFGSATANLIGYTNIDEVGLEGVELTQNEKLQGTHGLKRVLKDNKGEDGRIIEVIENIRMVENGEDVTLTIDSRIQEVAYRALNKVIEKERANLATCVVVDVHTGHILAIAIAPSFNPNNFRERKAIRNFAATDVFEPGSIIKPFAVAKAMMNGAVNAKTIIDTHPGWLYIGGFSVEDIRNFGQLTVEDVIMKSSNVGVVKIGTQVSPQDLSQFYKNLGFNEKTGSGLLGENNGIFPKRDRWYTSEHATLTYGYGFAVTALQIVQAYAAVANGGDLISLRIVKDGKPSKSRRVLPSRVAREMTQMLERVVTPTGTSKRAKVPLYRVAGKTATVQKLIDGQYSENQHLAMFVGFAPVSSPKFAAVVIVDDPQAGSYYGGAVAAPAFREILTSALRIWNVPPDDFDQFAKKSDSEKQKKS